MLSKSTIKYIQSLGQKKFREHENCFIAEGTKMIGEILASPQVGITGLYALKEWAEENTHLTKTLPVNIIEPHELEKISQLNTPNAVLAVVKQIEHDGEINVDGNFVLALDNIQDPGNLGTIIRIADWFGINQIVCSTDSADCYNPKVIQSTMGSILRVKIFYKNLTEWLSQLPPKTQVLATALNGVALTKLPPFEQGILIIGNESKGISDEVVKFATEKITIARVGGAESLNAAVATGIVLSHVVKA